MAVLAFYSDCHGQIEHVESQCNWHCLTPFREVWLTACRCVQRLTAEAAYLEYHISTRYASPVQRCRAYFYCQVLKARKKARRIFSPCLRNSFPVTAVHFAENNTPHRPVRHRFAGRPPEFPALGQRRASRCCALFQPAGRSAAFAGRLRHRQSRSAAG